MATSPHLGKLTTLGYDIGDGSYEALAKIGDSLLVPGVKYTAPTSKTSQLDAARYYIQQALGD